MQNATALLYCPNCQSPNPEQNKFCQQCQTRLPKHYLWAVGQAIEGYEVGDILDDRYLLKSSRVLLDIQPSWPVENQSGSNVIEPYLRLFPYRLHVPQVYGSVWAKEAGQSNREIVLLEQVPITHEDLQGAFEPDPSIGSATLLEVAWCRANTLRQLNWLWQMAQLWQPLSSQRVVSSLLQPELLRVEGPLVRLLELRLDLDSEPTLADLGQLWLQWISNAQTEIAAPLEALCQQMIQGQVGTAEHLTNQLDQWLTSAGTSQSYQVEIATRTDQGPSRKHNEDACYPPDVAIETSSPLTIVCDGVGGHAGGAIASGIAIETLKQQLQDIQIEAASEDLVAELEEAVCVANDAISQRNDSEQRQDRQRMGTTVVMALAKAHELYITHVGDSRAYWITPSGCYQVTLDDDVASREVRLGYMFYRIALQHPASGALVQALGMGPSAVLHPTVQRFILDEDCVFLLCSDGLSDYDRVEQSWETEILPILDHKVDLATATQRLIALANTLNGHDNVTVSLVHCQVRETGAAEALQHSSAQPGLDSPTSAQSVRHPGATDFTPLPLNAHPQVKRSTARPWFLLGIFLALGLGGLVAYLTYPMGRQMDTGSIGPSTPTLDEPPSQSPRVNPAPIPSPALPLQVDSLVQLSSSAPGNPQAQAAPIILLRGPGKLEAVEGRVLAGSVLQIRQRAASQQQGKWLKVKVCTSPAVALPSANSPPLQPSSPSPTAIRSLEPGTTGWIQESVITRVALPTPPNQQDLCATSPSPAVPGNT